MERGSDRDVGIKRVQSKSLMRALLQSVSNYRRCGVVDDYDDVLVRRKLLPFRFRHGIVSYPNTVPTAVSSPARYSPQVFERRRDVSASHQSLVRLPSTCRFTNQPMTRVSAFSIGGSSGVMRNKAFSSSHLFNQLSCSG